MAIASKFLSYFRGKKKVSSTENDSLFKKVMYLSTNRWLCNKSNFIRLYDEPDKYVMYFAFDVSENVPMLRLIVTSDPACNVVTTSQLGLI